MTPSGRVPLRRITRDLRPHARLLALGSVAAVLVAVGVASGPLLIGLTIDRGVVQREIAWVAVGAGGFLLTSALQLGSQWAQIRWMGRFAHDYMRRLREELVDQLFGLDLDFFSRVRTGRLISRLTSDVENLQRFVEHGLALVMRAVMTVTFTIGVMLVASSVLTLVAVAVVAPLGVATMWFRRHAFRAQVDVRERMADLLGHVSESLNGSRVIQAYTYEDPRREAFRQVNGDTYAAKRRTFVLNARYYTVVEFLQPVAIAAVIGVGALQVADGAASVGTVVAFTLYVGRLFQPIQQLAELAQIFQQAAASYGKIFAFRDERPKVRDAPDAVSYRPGDGRIDVEHATFRYDERGPSVIRDVTLTVPAGQRLALVGSSGAGKSTLAKLVARFYDVTEGRILVDGQDVCGLTGQSLRRHVALVPQEGFLFDGTIADNIAVAAPGRTRADRADIEEACEALGIRRRLEALPEGLDTHVTSGGLSLSSGQRQLIALTRVLVAEPRIVILDEATSNLDPATDALVEQALSTLLAGRTAVIIAHRVETAMRADRVLMMAQGEIAEDGEPEDLVVAGGVFSGWVTQVRAAATPQC